MVRVDASIRLDALAVADVQRPPPPFRTTSRGKPLTSLPKIQHDRNAFGSLARRFLGCGATVNRAGCCEVTLPSGPVAGAWHAPCLRQASGVWGILAVASSLSASLAPETLRLAPVSLHSLYHTDGRNGAKEGQGNVTGNERGPGSDPTGPRETASPQSRSSNQPSSS